MGSVKFDNIELINTTYIPRYVKHESSPDRELGTLDLTKQDGSILVSERYGKKKITLTGYLTGTSETLLETAIDSFKELFSRKEKNLDIEFAGGTRRYVATCSNHEFDRDHFHLLFVPWTAEFIVLQGIGEDVSETTLVNNQSFSAVDYSGQVVFLGSAKPKMRIRVKCDTVNTTSMGLSIENTDNSSKIIITRQEGFGAGKYFEVDCRLKKVMYDGIEVPFYGLFPSFEAGSTSNYKIKIGQIIDQSYEPSDLSTSSVYYGNNSRAQSFMVPYKDTTYKSIAFLISKIGTPPNSLGIKIVNDLNGVPDETSEVADAEFHIDPATVGTSPGWVKVNTWSGNPFTLEANKKYWIVPKIDGGSGSVSDCFGIVYIPVGAYKKGNVSRTIDGGATWTDEPDSDLAFRLYYAGLEEISLSNYHFDIFYYKRYL